MSAGRGLDAAGTGPAGADRGGGAGGVMGGPLRGMKPGAMRDLLVVGRIHTLAPAAPLAGAVLVRDGRFAWVGSAAECQARARPGAERLDLGGGCATPGLADAHGHVLWHGRSLVEVRCEGLPGEEACAARVAAFARGVPEGRWIRGQGWNHNLWPGARFPTAALLDAAAPAHPVLLTRADGHAVWVNGRALALAGVGKDTPDPPGGRLERHPDGRPTGVLVDHAARLVLDRVPPLSAAEIEEATVQALRGLARSGLTAVHDAGVSPEGLEIYRRLALEDRLPLRVYAMIDGQAPRAVLDERMARWRESPEVGRLAVRAVKLFADGALASRGAALFEPYADDPGNVGLDLTEPGELRERIRAVARAGFQPAVHAIGDRACAGVLRAFRAARDEGLLGSIPPRVEHLQTLLARDALLLSGVVASMQPIHAVCDAPWAERRLGHGTDRQRGAYAWRSALAGGAVLAFGSDFPVESFDVRLGLRAAELRLPAGWAEPWMPEQRLGREEALRAYTVGPAVAALAGGRRGTVEVGRDADLSLFDRDLVAVPADELPGVAVEGTVVAGRVEYGGGVTPR